MAVEFRFQVEDDNELEFGLASSNELEFGTRDVVEVRQTGDYPDLTNKPSINGVTLIGDKTSEDLHIHSGTYDHDELNNRDLPDQHPISSITGLAEILANAAQIIENTSAGWATQIDYVPKHGEIVVYSDYDVLDGKDVPNIKIGDGTTYVVDLPFVNDDLRAQFIAHVNNKVIHITAAERSFWNAKLNYDDVINENLVLTRS